MAVDTKAMWRKIRDKKNVVGYRKSLVALRGRWYFRVYVSKKQPAGKLNPEDAIPEMLDGVRVDVADIQELYNLDDFQPRGSVYFRKPTKKQRLKELLS